MSAHRLQVFAMRSLAYMSVVWAERHFQVDQPLYSANVGIVMITMALADVATRSVAHPSSSVTNLAAPLIVKYYFSVAQVGGYSPPNYSF